MEKKFKLYDYVDAHGRNIIKEWAEGLQKKHRGKLNAKLDMLSIHGPDLFPNTLTGSPTPGIQKLRVHGNVQLRPLLCEGPIDVNSEFTLLAGAKEVGGKLIPSGIDSEADIRKGIVIQNIARRCTHERVS